MNMATPNVFTSTNVYGVFKSKDLNDSTNTSLITRARAEFDGLIQCASAYGGWILRDNFLFNRTIYNAATPSDYTFSRAELWGGVTEYTLRTKESGETHLNSATGQNLLIGVGDVGTIRIYPTNDVEILVNKELRCNRFKPMNTSANTTPYLGGFIDQTLPSSINFTPGVSTVTLCDDSTNTIRFHTGQYASGTYMMVVSCTIYTNIASGDSLTLNSVQLDSSIYSNVTHGHSHRAQNRLPYSLTRTTIGNTLLLSLQVTSLCLAYSGDDYVFASITVDFSRTGTTTLTLESANSRVSLVRVG